MQWFFSKHSGTWLLCALSFWAQAQAPAPSVGSTDGVALPGGYISPLATYRPYVDTSLQDWRNANQTVHRIGGWRTYAKEAQSGSVVPRPEPTPALTPPAEGGLHQGH